MTTSTTVRFSQFNASLNRNAEGQLITDLSTPNNAQAQATAEIIQRNNPDVLLINEFDYVSSNPQQVVQLLQQNYLGVSQNGAAPVQYPYVYIAPSNTGISSGFDLNNNGAAVTTIGAAGYGDDSFGFGNFPGQFGMLLLSKYEIDTANIRTFQNFLWKDMPGNLLTNDPTVDNPATAAVNENLNGFYSPAEINVLRLSSKSHWDIPIKVNGETVHLLLSHPTPPTFDGTEDRNGKRNADEIRFWSDYITSGQDGYIYDDKGKTGGIAAGSSFVIMGDQNADPVDGDSYNNAIRQLLLNPNVNTNSIPASEGGIQQAGLQGGANTTQKGNPAFDTADFADGAPGNLRTDYVLPSADLQISNSAVYWPLNTDPNFKPVGVFPFPSSDHRLIFADVQVGGTEVEKSVVGLSFQGQTTFPTGFIPTGAAGAINGVAVPAGGLSGVTFDAEKNQYYAISDDRSTNARFYTFTLDPVTKAVMFTNVIQLKDANGNPFATNSLDPEGIALTQNGTVFISSEGEANPSVGRVTDPFVKEFSLTTGQELRSLPVPKKFLPVVQDTNNNAVIDVGDTQTSGIRNNLAFESLTISPNQKTLYTATENALFQDGAAADASTGTRSRILQYSLKSGQPEKEYLYVTDSVAVPPNPATAFATNGLVDLLAIDDQGTLLALERSFSTGAPGTGNTIKIYEISLPGATDISFTNSLGTLSTDQLAAIAPVKKRLLLNLDELALPTGLDNVEGITFGPKLADGRQSIVLVSDNNFSATQFTQILTLGAVITPTETLIASGDTTQTSTVLWTRSEYAGLVTFQYATDAEFKAIAGSVTATITDPLQPAKVEVTGLKPGTDYFYRVTDVAGTTTIGKFSTAAKAGTQSGLRFGVTGDWRGELAPYPAISNADERDLKFFVELGDTIYADYPSPALKNPDGTEKEQALTLEDYRIKHNEVYSSRLGQNDWADLRASTSVFATVDDHEVVNDFQGGEDLAKASANDQALYGATTGLVNDSPLYNSGLQAFQEYNPLQDLSYGSTGDPRTEGERKLYRATTYGSDAVNIVLDARSFRDPGLPPVTNIGNPAQVGGFLAQSFNPSRTFLGRIQVDDLKRDLLQAQKDGVTWKFINLPEPIQNIGVLAASDRYEGYAAERTEILKFIDDNNINNVVFIAADIHGTLVNNLTYQLAPGQAQIATNAFEITTGSVAFDAPFGSTVAELAAGAGILSPAQQAFYNSLPVANDGDSILNDKDDFIKSIVDGGLAPLGYDPLGLNKNLAQADGLINAKLLQGDYVATQTYGWTEFEIDPTTQKLTVTTYGIEPYTRAELEANPSLVTRREPKIVSQFEVEANPVVAESKLVAVGTASDDDLIALNGKAFDGRSNIVFTGAGSDSVDLSFNPSFAVGNNRIELGRGADTIFVSQGDRVFGNAGNDVFEATEGKGNNRMSGGAGNDIFFLGKGDRALGGDGDDQFFVGSGGDNLLSGGAGADQFWIANAELPSAANTVLDFQIGSDVIGIKGASSLGISTSSLKLTQVGEDTSIDFGGQSLAVLKGIQASSLTLGSPAQFVFA
jgi:phosphodiesterase/alkaline phosphatase D-like protein